MPAPRRFVLRGFTTVMEDADRSRRLWVPRRRRLSCDVLHYHRRVPTCAHSRRIDLARLAALRSALPRRISWAALFLKAFGVVSRRRPVLRQCWMPVPVPHVYQSAHSVAMLAVQREFRGEPWLFWARFVAPENDALPALQWKLDRYLHGGVERVFRLQWKFSGFPAPVRRLLWWWTLNASGATRVRRTGTFFLTTLAARGVEIDHPPAFLTSNLTYGPLDEHGRSRVTLAYDHRLFDGSEAADALGGLDETLNTIIVEELRRLAGTAACDEETLVPGAA